MLLRLSVISAITIILLNIAWYFWFLHRNRRRAAEVVGWIERAFQGHGRVLSMHWVTASRFQVRMDLLPAIFVKASLMVQLFPRELAFLWVWCRARREQERLTFQADLYVPPGFNLEVHNHRWYGRTRRRWPLSPAGWTLEQSGPFVLTTRNDWQREITSMMSALGASRECDCSTVCFRRSSPHFSATVPLEAISPDSQTRTEIYDVLREIAAGASTARF
jgi:hypothetical protein